MMSPHDIIGTNLRQKSVIIRPRPPIWHQHLAPTGTNIKKWHQHFTLPIKKWGKKKNRLMLINTLCPSASKQSLQMINMTRKIYEDEDAIGHIPQTLK